MHNIRLKSEGGPPQPQLVLQYSQSHLKTKNKAQQFYRLKIYLNLQTWIEEIEVISIDR